MVQLLYLVILLEASNLIGVSAARIRGNKNREQLQVNNDDNSKKNTQPTSTVPDSNKNTFQSSLPQEKKTKDRRYGQGVPRHQPLTADNLDSLRFTYKANQRLRMKEIKKIKDPLKRARACKPTEKRLVLQSHGKHGSSWVTTDQTNAEYVAQQMNASREQGRAKYEREKNRRALYKAQTGITQVSSRTVQKQRRIARAEQGSRDDIMTFVHNGQTYQDPLGRKKGEYLGTLRQKHRQQQMKYEQKYKSGRSKGKNVQIQTQLQAPVQIEKTRQHIDLNQPPPEDSE